MSKRDVRQHIVPCLVFHVNVHENHVGEGLAEPLREPVGLQVVRCGSSVTGLVEPKSLPSQLSRKCCSFVFRLVVSGEVIRPAHYPPISQRRRGEWPE